MPVHRDDKIRGRSFIKIYTHLSINVMLLVSMYQIENIVQHSVTTSTKTDKMLRFEDFYR